MVKFMNNRIAFFLIVVIVVAGSLGAVFAFKSADDKNNLASTNNSVQNQATENQSNVLGASTQNEAPKNILQKISPKEASALIKSKNDDEMLKIIDIRTEEEYKQGNIDGSINIDFNNNFENELSKLNKDYTYLVYCQSGKRSDEAMKFFNLLGFNKVYELEGGYSAWIEQ